MSNTKPSDGSTYIAIEDCFIKIQLVTNLNKGSVVLLNGYEIAAIGVSDGTISLTNIIPLKTGDIITFKSVSHGNTNYEVLGVR